MGRHRGPDVPAKTPRFPWALWPLVAVLVVLVPAAVAMGWRGTWAPTAQAASPALPPVVDQADDPGARGGPLALPELVPAGTPVWEPAKGTVVVDGLPLDHPRSTGSTATRTTRTPSLPASTTGSASPTVEPPAPPPPPPVVVEPPPDCASPLVECACDHDPFVDCEGNPRTPIGLPPVVVVPDDPDAGELPDDDEDATPEPPTDDDAPEGGAPTPEETS